MASRLGHRSVDQVGQKACIGPWAGVAWAGVARFAFASKLEGLRIELREQVEVVRRHPKSMRYAGGGKV